MFMLYNRIVYVIEFLYQLQSICIPTDLFRVAVVSLHGSLFICSVMTW